MVRRSSVPLEVIPLKRDEFQVRARGAAADHWSPSSMLFARLHPPPPSPQGGEQLTRVLCTICAAPHPNRPRTSPPRLSSAADLC